MGVLAYLFLSYFIGCIMFGYIIGRVFGKFDIRTVGSGNVGARNIGRSLNKSAFAATFLGDAAKGATVILLGQELGFPKEIPLLGLLFVLFGHIWPVTLSFKGGKGISSFLGGLIAFEPTLALVIIVCFFISYPFTRSFTLSGLLSFLILPFYLLYKGHAYTELALASLMIAIIIFAHRSNITERI